jgi:hypothetical protein
MSQVPGESHCLRWAINRPFLRENLDLSFKSAHCLVYYLAPMLYVDTSTSKTSFLAGPAGIAAD